jgi:hypothetical protein
LASGVLGAFEEHAVQNGARVDDDGLRISSWRALLLAMSSMEE